ncbi:MAG: glycosyltransferase [Ottowia sp.]|nr:glycosyltransferase [Ottowia sp.]
MATVFFAKHKISTIIEQYGPLDCAYCYWHSEIAYAACMMKRSGSIDHVAARAHRTDVYEYLGFDGYMPLKRQFGTKFDAIYAISLDCQTYLEQTYHIPSRIIHLSRLGVCVPLIPGSGSIDNVVRIVSVSFCVSIKRIDKIIDAIQAASALNTNLSISWIHIGDGLLRSDLERYASIKLNHPNISFSFIGERDNSEVLDHYASKAVDIFINCSASEGVPVSIMEAMSYGIPAIAPDVGGVSELVNDECGVLLPHNFSDLDISDAIIHLVGEKRQKFRDAARFKVIREYSAEVNYIKFVMSIRALCETGRT